MSKEMIISVNGREKKIAILDNGQVTEFYIERDEENAGIVGNIYKGKVQRVLPGMQSAFVDIGLERDAFLYVSDFFDEEEEIERIVLAKSKEQKSPEEADKEATDHIQRERLKREKEMEDAQERAEISDEDAEKEEKEEKEERSGRGRRGGRSRRKQEEPESAEEPAEEKEEEEKPKRGRRSRKDTRKEEAEEAERENVLEVTDLDFGDSDFERIVDEDEDPGEMLKDAMTQEAIIDNVRSIEFDMEESTEFAEVGSLFDSVSDLGNGFERVADEEEEEKPKKSSRGRSKAKSSGKTSSRSKKKADEEEAEETEEAPKKTTPRRKRSTSSRAKKSDEASEDESGEDTGKKPAAKRSTRSRSTRSRKSASSRSKKADQLPDGEASVKESDDVSEMAARRGSRGGRRKNESGAGKSPVKSKTHTDKSYKTTDAEQPIVADDAIAEAEFKKPKGRKGGSGRSRRSGGKGQPKISDLLSQGQEILVQIAKEPIAKKGARITSHIALPGRFLVYMPTIEHLGVSRKIDSAKERGRLRSIITNIVTKEDVPSGGFIVRTAGVGKSEKELHDDAKYLLNTWYDIRSDAEKSKSPAVIHQDLDIILRLLRDHLSDDFAAIRVDSEEEYLRIIEFVNRIQPAMVKRVKFHTLDEPILDSYGVSEEIDKALKHRVWLKSGGYLVINQTEALIAIDVNTGKFVGKGNARLEDTITKTNLEAVDEISRQIRLRDLGGIIVLDLIDMEDRNNRKKVLQALQEALQADKSPTKVLSFNDFGLIIMTRKRVKQSLERTLCSPCDYCEGAGWIKSAQTICYEILEEARRISKGLSDVRETTLRVHPEVSKALRGEERLVLDEIEAYLGPVDLTGDKSLHQEKFAFAFV
ncbi:MAG: Rne/Rng family ribonuclease [Aridibacter famidurans]|nr:Rne/Rng family ribonuclease [Aridibacter famidurans]